MCLVKFILRNAVIKLNTQLTGKSNSPTALLPGYVSGSPSSIVIQLKDELEPLLVEYWESKCDTTEEAEAVMRKHPKWFGVVDGCQLHLALMGLREESPEE